MSVDGGARAKILDDGLERSDRVARRVHARARLLLQQQAARDLRDAEQAGATATQVTTTPTAEWRAFNWIDPKVITFKARDGVDVYARSSPPR